MTSAALKNGALIFKDGKAATSCACCEEDPCYETYSSVIVSATASDFFRRTSYSPPLGGVPHAGTQVTHNHLFFPGSQYVGQFELLLTGEETYQQFFGAGIIIHTTHEWSYTYPPSSLLCEVVNEAGDAVVLSKITIRKAMSRLHVVGQPVQNISVGMFFRGDFVVLRDCGTLQKTAADINCNGAGGNEIHKLGQLNQFYTNCQNTSTLGFATPIAFAVPLIQNFAENQCQQIGGPFLSQVESGSLNYSLNVLEWIA